MFRLPALVRWTSLTFAAGVASLPAQSGSTITFDTHYNAQNISMGSTSTPSIISFNQFVGTTWNQSTGNYGSMTTGLFGEPWGLVFSAATSGKVGFDVMFKSTSGTLNVDLPNTISLSVPNLTATNPSSPIVVHQARDFSNVPNVLTSTFPQAQFSVDAEFHVNASVTADVGYGVGRSSGSLTLTDMFHYSGLLVGNPATLAVDPFNQNVPLVSYNVNNSGKINLLGGLFGIAEKNLNDGFTYPINTNTFTTLPKVTKALPTALELGSIQFVGIQLDAASGTAMKTVDQQDTVLAVRANLLGLSSLAIGLPFNPFEPKVYIPGTPLLVEANLLDIDAGLNLGLRQTITLQPQTRLVLTSTQDITYNVNGQLYITSALDVLLPDDGSDFSISIVSKPADPTLQIFPSIYVSPIVMNKVELGLAPSLKITALSLGIGAFGFGGGLGPVYSQEWHPDPYFVDIYNKTFNIGGLSQFSRHYRTLDSLVNNGIALGADLAIQASEEVNIVNREQNYQTTDIPLNAALRISGGLFKNTTDLTLAANSLLALENDALAETRALNLAASSQVTIDAHSKLVVRGQLDSQGAPILDADDHAQPGFIDADGTLANGGLAIAGQLFYQGPDIRKIGSGASLALIDNDYVGRNAPDNLLHLVNGLEMDSLGHTLGHDPLTSLETLDGALILDGPHLALTHSLSLGGLLDLRSGSVFSAPGLTATGSGLAVGTVFMAHDTQLDISGGTFGNLSSGSAETLGGVLSNINLVLGDASGGAQLRYAGDGIYRNDALVVLSGATPDGGFLSHQVDGQWTDGLKTLGENLGTLSLLNGATQTVTSGSSLPFMNSGLLLIANAGSRLTAPNGFANDLSGTVSVNGGRLETTRFSNTGSFNLADGGVLKVSSIANLTAGTNWLTGGGEWIIGGHVDTGGATVDLRGLDAGTTLTMRTRAADWGNGSVNSFGLFGTNAGNFNVVEGAVVGTTTTFTNLASGVLTVAGQEDTTGNTRSRLTVNRLVAQLGTVNVGTYGLLDTTGGYGSVSGVGLLATTASSLPMTALGDGTLTGDLAGNVWNIGGTVRYDGKLITGIAAGTTLDFKPTVAAPALTASLFDTNSAGKYFQSATAAGDVDGLTRLASIGGTVTLESDTALRTDVSFNLLAGGTLNINEGAAFQVTGETLTLADGSHFNLAGSLILGGFGDADGPGGAAPWSRGATFKLPHHYTFTNENGEVQLGRVTVDGTGAAARFMADGYGVLESAVAGGTWTNASTLIRGVGTLRGASIVNQGGIYAAGGTLTLDATDGEFINSGQLGSSLGINGTSSLHVDSTQITNFQTINGQLAQGLIDIEDQGVFTSTLIHGGNVFIGPQGTLTLNASHVTLTSLASDGTTVNGVLMNYGNLVLGNGPTSVRGNFELGRSGRMTVQQAASLDIDPTLGLRNNGTVTFAGGTLFGGTFTNNGYLNITASSVLGRIDNLVQGNINLFNGVEHTIRYSADQGSTITNQGYIHLSPEDPTLTPNSTSSLLLTRDFTFTGGGAIQLGGYNTSDIAATGENFAQLPVIWANAGTGRIDASGGGAARTLTNLDHTIQGAGSIGGAGNLRVVNEVGGVIRAMGDGQTLSIDVDPSLGGFTNRGTLIVESGATLLVNGAFSSFADGRIFEGDYRIAGTLQLPTVGSFDNTVSFLFYGPNATIRDANNHTIAIHNNLATGSLTVGGGFNYTADTDVTGEFRNEGKVAVIDGSTFSILGNGGFRNYLRPATNPEVSLNTLDGGTWSVVNGTLKFTGADIQANGTKLTLGGSAAQIVDETGGNALANFSANLATGELTIVAGNGTTTGSINYTLPTSVAEFTNAGKITATDLARFTFGAGAGVGDFANLTGGLLAADNARFNLPAIFSVVNEGTLRATNHSTFNVVSPVFVNHSLLTVEGASTLNIQASDGLTNHGTIAVASGSTFNFTGATFEDLGLLDIGGTMAITAHTISHTGPLTVGPNAQLSFDGLDSNSSLSLGNVVTVGTNASLTIGASIGSFTGRTPANETYAIRVADTGTLYLRSSNVTGMTTTDAAASQGGLYQIEGTLKLDSPLTHLGADLTFYGPNTAVIDATGANAFALSTITSSGVLTLGGNTTSIAAPLSTNHGLVKVGGASVVDAAGVAHDIGGRFTLTSNSLAGSGTVKLHDGTLTLARPTVGTFTLESRIEGRGLIDLADATSGLTVGTSGVISADTGTLALQAPVTSNGRIEVSSGSTLTFLQAPSLLGTVDVAGTLLYDFSTTLPPTLAAGLTLNLHGADAKFLVASSGIGNVDYFRYLTANYGNVTVTDGAQTYLGSTARNFFNAGTFTIGDSATVTGYHLNNTGTFVIDGGTLTASDFHNAAGGSLRVNGSLLANVHGAGDVHIFGGESNLLGVGSTYTGRTIVESGASLTVGSDAALGSRPSTASLPADQLFLDTGATLTFGSDLAAWRDVTYRNNATITGNGNILGTLAGTGTLNIGGDQTLGNIVGAHLVTSGNINVVGDLALLSGSSITGNLYSTYDTARLLVSGSTVNLVGSYDFQGTVEVNQLGALTIGDGGAVGSFASAALRIDNGSLIINRNGPVLLGHEITGPATATTGIGLFLRGGVQAVTSTSGNNYLGATSIDAGSSFTVRQGTFGSVVANGALLLTPGAGKTATVGAVSGTGTFGVSGPGTGILSDVASIGSIGINSGGTLQVGTGGALSGSLFSSAIANNGALTFNHSGNLSVLGTISGSGGVTLAGSGNLSLAAGNTYTGATTVRNGKLIVSSDSALGATPGSFAAANLILDGGAVSFAAGTSLAATRGVTVGAGGGTFYVTDFSLATPIGGTGAIAVNDGVLRLTLASGSNPHSFAANDAFLYLDNPNANSSVGALFSNAAGAIVITGTGVTKTTGTSLTAGLLTISSGATLDFSGTNTGSLSVDGHLISSGAALGHVTGAGSLTTGTASSTGTDLLLGGNVTVNSGAGLSLSSTYRVAGTTTLNSGVLAMDSGRTGALAIDGISSLIVGTGRSFVVDGPLTGSGSIGFTGDTLQLNNVGSSSLGFLIGTGSGSNGGNASTLRLANTEAIVLGGNVNGPGALLAVAGSGVASLTGTATFAGGTAVGPGATLQIGHGGTTGSLSSAVVLASNAFLSVNRSDDVHLFAGPANLPAGALSATSSLTGAGGLSQDGTGLLIVDTALAYTGSTRINSGTLQIGDGGANGSLARDIAADPAHGVAAVHVGAIVNDARLVFNRTGSLALDNDISGTGTVTQIGTGATTLGGESNFHALAVNAGTVTLAHTNTIATTTVSTGATLALADGVTVGNVPRSGSLTGAVANSGTLSLARSGDYATTFTATGTGLLAQNGSGTAYLVGATQTNALAVNTGHLATIVAANETTTLNGPVAVAAGTSFVHAGPGTLTLNNGISGSGTLDAASGTTRLAGGAFATDIQVGTGATVEIAHDMGFSRSIAGAHGAVRIVGSDLALVGAINVGTTTIDATSQLGLYDGSSLTGNVVNHGVVAFNYSLGHDITFASAVGGSGALLQNGAGKVTITGVSTATGGATIAANRTLALAGAGSIGGLITNHGTLEVITTAGTSRTLPGNITGTGTLALSGPGTVVFGGDLANATTLADGVTLGVTTSGTSTFSNSLNGAGNLAVGTGTLVMTGTTVLDGDVTITSGTLQIGDGVTDGHLSANHIVDNGTLAYNRNLVSGTDLSQISGTGNLRQMGASTLAIVGDNPDFVGDTIVDATRTLTIGNADGSAGSVGGGLVVDGTLFYRRTGVVANAINGASTGRFVSNSGGDLTLTGGAHFLGELTTTGTLTLNGGTVDYHLDRITAAGLVNHGLLTLTGDSSGRNAPTFTVTNDGTLTFGTGGTSGWLADSLTIANAGTVVVNRSDHVTLGSGVGISGDGLIRQDGTGRTTIGHTVTASTLEANAGVLELLYPTQNATAGFAPLKIAATGTALLNSGAYANLITNAGLLQTAGDVQLTNQNNLYTGGLDLGTGTLTIRDTADPLHENQIVSGAVTGAGGLRYDAAGALQLTNASAHTGTLSTRGNLISTTTDLRSHVVFENGGVLQFASDHDTTFSGSLAGSLRHTGLGGFTLDTAYAGATEITQGALRLGTNGQLGGDLTLGNSAGTSFSLSGKNTTLGSLSGGGTLGGDLLLGATTLTLNGGTFAGSISGTGGLIKNSSGDLVLSGASTFTGGIAVNGGSLTLSAGSAGSAPATARADYLSFGGSGGYDTLNLRDGFTLAANQGITLGTSLYVNATGQVALNSNITGTGDIYLSSNGSTLLGGLVRNTGNLILQDNSIVALGRVDAIDVTKTIFRNGVTLDVHGFDWSAPLDFHQSQIADNVDGTVANSAANAITVSSHLTATNGIGLAGTGARLTFTGTVSSTVSPAELLTLTTNGEVALGTASAASFHQVNVLSGGFYAPIAAMTSLSALNVENGGGLYLTGTPGSTLQLSAVELKGDHSGVFNATGGAVTFKTDLVLTSTDASFRDTALIGGDSDLTFTGSISGQLSLLKVGAGNLFLSGQNEFNQNSVTGWSTANGGARLGVREGTLTTNLAVLENRGLVVEDAGHLVLTDSGTAALTLRNLGGDGTLDLGSRDLTMNLVGTGDFTGTLTTTGTVTHNVTGGMQTYGTVNAGALVVNFGDVIVTDALNTDYVTVYASGAAGSLTTTTRGLTSSNAATELNASLQVQGTLRLTEGSTIAGNAGFINLVGLAATISDGATATSTLTHLTSNRGQINVSQGAVVSGAAATFTNTGSVSIGGATGATSSRWDGFNVVNNSGLFSWSGYQLTGSNSASARFVSTGGTVEMLNGASFVSTSGSAANQPAFSVTGGSLVTSGAASIAGGLALSGATFAPGGNGTIGTLAVAGGVLLGGGTHVLWDINDALGLDGVNRDLVTATAMPGQTDGKITFAGSAANPILFSVNNPTSTGLIHFDETQPISWIVATTTDGFSGYSSDQFIVDLSHLFTSYTGNFGLVTSGNNLLLQYYQSHTFDTSTGAITVTTPLAAMGDFGGLRKTGSGTLTLAAANLYTGVTNLDAGTLVLAADGALGTGRLNLNGGTLQSDVARTVANGLTLSASSTIGGAANLTFTGALLDSSGSRTLSVSNTGTTTFGDIDLTNLGFREKLTLATTGGDVKVMGTISGSTAEESGLTKTGTGSLTLAGANTYGGLTTLSGGTLVLGHNTALGTSTLVVGGTVTVQGDGSDHTLANRITLGGNMTIGGTSNLSFTGPLTLTSSRTLTLTNTGTTTLGNILNSSASPVGRTLTIAGAGNLVVNGTVSNASIASTSLTKNGTGTLSLFGTSTYTGATTINSGRLIVDGSIASSALTTINLGATLSGTGTVGFATIASGGTIAPGNSPGTLTFTNGLTLADGAVLDFELGSTSDRIVVSGGTLTGSASAGGITFNLSDAGGFAAGTYTLFDFSTGGTVTSSFDVADFAFGSTIAGFSYNLAQVGSTLQLTASASAVPEPSTYALLLGAAALLAVGRNRLRRPIVN